MLTSVVVYADGTVGTMEIPPREDAPQGDPASYPRDWRRAIPKHLDAAWRPWCDDPFEPVAFECETFTRQGAMFRTRQPIYCADGWRVEEVWAQMRHSARHADTAWVDRELSRALDHLVAEKHWPTVIQLDEMTEAERFPTWHPHYQQLHPMRLIRRLVAVKETK